MFPEIQQWLSEFQESINAIIDGTFLKFMMEIWRPCEKEESMENNCMVRIEPIFPFFDIEMSWMSKIRLNQARLSTILHIFHSSLVFQFFKLQVQEV